MVNVSPVESADEKFVIRYIDLVYAAAIRQVHDASTAEDVTQAVMILLIKKTRAGVLPEDRFIAGWLIKTTRYIAMQVKRSAARRAMHERSTATASTPAQMNTGIEGDVREALDESLLSMGAIDREVIVRRYLHGDTLAEVASAVGLNENTAGRRVARALEKLRAMLSRRGVTAPTAVVLSVLGLECSMKAQVAFAGTATASATSLAHEVIRKMAIAKLLVGLVAAATTILIITRIMIAVFSAGTHNHLISGPAAQATAAPSTAPLSPGPVNVEIVKTIEGPSPQLLSDLLNGLKANQDKLQTIHVTGISIAFLRDPTANVWLDPQKTEGQAWGESGSKRRLRSDVTLNQTRTWLSQPGNTSRSLGPIENASFLETWDGESTHSLFVPPHSRPSAETFANRYVLGEQLLGRSFSMQLPFDEETSGDSNGTRITIDRYPLDPAVLAKMKLSARKVELAGNQIAMELTIDIPDPAVARREIFWVDPQRGYGLLARRDSLNLNGRQVRQRTYVIEQMVQAAPGVFYPAQATMLWEEQGEPFMWESFTASKVIANEQFPATEFQLTFPPGTKITDYINGRGTRRLAN